MDRRNIYKWLAIAVLVLIIVVLIAVLLYLLLNDSGHGHQTWPPGPKILIDHDGGADDAMAIFMALLFQKYLNGPPIIGFTTTHGNVGEHQVFINTQRILGIANRRDVPIYRGSKSSLVYTYPTDYWFGQDGLGDSSNVTYEVIEAEPIHAALALIQLSKEYPGELTVAAIGPLSNIALAIKLDPDFISRLSHLYIGGGHVHNANNSEPEFNAMLDVEAYHIVAEYSSSEKVTAVPFSSVIDSTDISLEWREDVLGAIPTEIMRNLNVFERISLEQALEGNNLWHTLDPAVMSLVLDQNIIGGTTYSNNSIILCGDQRGINTNTLSQEHGNVRLVTSINEELYKHILLDIFSSELN